MPRRIDLDARRADLAAAVWRVILTQGIGAVSLRHVAAEAGVALGSLRHVFPTRAQLVRYSAELVIDHATARIQATPMRDDSCEYAIAVLEQLLPLDTDRRAEMEVNIALIAESPALPALAEIRDITHQSIARLCLNLVAMVTQTKPDHTLQGQARTLHALVDGLAMHLLHQSAQDDTSWARGILRSHVEALAAAGLHPFPESGKHIPQP